MAGLILFCFGNYFQVIERKLCNVDGFNGTVHTASHLYAITVFGTRPGGSCPFIPLEWQDLGIDPYISVEFLLLQAPREGEGQSTVILKYGNINSKRECLLYQMAIKLTVCQPGEKSWMVS